MKLPRQIYQYALDVKARAFRREAYVNVTDVLYDTLELNNVFDELYSQSPAWPDTLRLPESRASTIDSPRAKPVLRSASPCPFTLTSASYGPCAPARSPSTRCAAAVKLASSSAASQNP